MVGKKISLSIESAKFKGFKGKGGGVIIIIRS